MGGEGSIDLGGLAAAGRGREGAVWTLGVASELNANLVRFGTGGGVGEHVNDEVDVIVVGIAGHGLVRVDGEEHPVSNGTLTPVPKGARRSTRSLSEDFAYLTVHRRRGPLRIGGRAADELASGEPLASPPRGTGAEGPAGGGEEVA